MLQSFRTKGSRWMKRKSKPFENGSRLLASHKFIDFAALLPFILDLYIMHIHYHNGKLGVSISSNHLSSSLVTIIFYNWFVFWKINAIASCVTSSVSSFAPHKFCSNLSPETFIHRAVSLYFHSLRQPAATKLPQTPAPVGSHVPPPSKYIYFFLHLVSFLECFNFNC